ncbi:MAG: dethiobiotin synthase [Deltaproteobacteria bacterium]|nr:dethiobiotin synthase [Deltaproteobacteria bacterium]
MTLPPPANCPVWVITATDTGVGKTTITRGLLHALCLRGLRPFPLKWVETGCKPLPDGSLLPADGLALAQAAHRPDELALIAPHRYRVPAAPTVASLAEGSPLTAAQLAHSLTAAQAVPADVLLLEGAGGALVPLTHALLFADALRSIQPQHTLVVARDALGTINHTLLTVEALERRGLTVPLIVLNQSRPESDPAASSAQELKRILGTARVRGPLPYLPQATDAALAQALEALQIPQDLLSLG